MNPDERTRPEPAMISALPVTPQELTVLEYMSRHGAICVSSACKKLHMSQPKLQRIKASLERKGLVTLAKTEPGERNPEMVRKYYDLTVPGFCELVVATVGLPVRAADVAYGDLLVERTGLSALPGWMPEVTFEEPQSLPAGDLPEATGNAAMETLSFQDFMHRSGHTGWFDEDEISRMVRRHATVCPLFFANWEALAEQFGRHTRLLLNPGVSVVLDGRTELSIILQAAMRRVVREVRVISSQMVSGGAGTGVFATPVGAGSAFWESLLCQALLRELFPDPDRMYRPYVAILAGFEETLPVLREYLRGMQEDCVRQGEQVERILEECGVCGEPPGVLVEERREPEC